MIIQKGSWFDKNDFNTGPCVYRDVVMMNIKKKHFEIESGYALVTLRHWFSGQTAVNDFEAQVLIDTLERFKSGQTKKVNLRR